MVEPATVKRACSERGEVCDRDSILRGMIAEHVFNLRSQVRVEQCERHGCNLPCRDCAVSR